MKNRCVSITGATGFIGAHAVRAFRSRGWDVRAVVRPGSRKAVADGVEVREADLLSESALAVAFSGADVVIHAAGVVRAQHRRELETVNLDGTRAVVAAANSASARLIHLSSLAAMGPATAERPAREGDPPHPINAYGRSKLAGEAVVRATAAGAWIILRPSAVYGPGDRGFLPVVRMANRGLFPLAAPEAMTFTFVYVDDVANALVCAAESEVGGETFFVGHRTPETTGALLRAMASALGRTYRPFPVPIALVRLAAVIGDAAWQAGARPLLDSSRLAELTAPGFVCDVDRARHYLGFTADVPLTDGVARTVSWYRERGWI